MTIKTPRKCLSKAPYLRKVVLPHSDQTEAGALSEL